MFIRLLRLDDILNAKITQSQQVFQTIHIDLITHKRLDDVEIGGIGAPPDLNIIFIRVFDAKLFNEQRRTTFVGRRLICVTMLHQFRDPGEHASLAKIKDFESFLVQVKGMDPPVMGFGTIYRPFLREFRHFGQIETFPEIMMTLAEPELGFDMLILTAMVQSYHLCTVNFSTLKSLDCLREF